jgi:4'-phosphopantetheinyl transferase EntD
MAPWQTHAVERHRIEDGTVPALEDLLPRGVACALLREPPADFALLPAEQEAARHMGARRYAEFLHGRACARLALAQLGLAHSAVLPGANREPVWPDGIVGSISHAPGIAAAVVSWQSEFASLGLDVERASPLDAELLARVCRPDEIARWTEAAQPPLLLAKLTFCIKEAAYKCCWPLCGEFLEFHDIEVSLDMDAARYGILSHTRQLPADLAARLYGRFQITPSWLAASAVIEQRGTGTQT